MYRIAVIGAGQLGSRHLQGLMKARNEMEVWVIDQSCDSLQVAKERCEQVEKTTPKIVNYADSIDKLPDSLDLVIVATGSKPRAAIVKSLLAHSRVRYAVLEKFLFTKLAEYDEVAELLSSNHVKCWVDCTRRMFECYADVRSLIDQSKPVVMEHYGQNWGLCCNTVHFIDLWMYLAGDSPFDVDLSEVEPRVLESKRKGYIEINGKETFVSKDGDKLTLACYDTYEGDSSIRIENASNLIVVDEAKRQWSYNGEMHDARFYMQSEISGKMADEILEKGESRLVDYLSSAEYHKPYLMAVMDFMNKIQGWESDSCPIT